MNKGELYYLTVIAERSMKDELIKALSKEGLVLISTTYGHGVAKANEFLHALGFVVENKKVVIAGLLLQKNKSPIFRMLKKQFGFDKPNTGIAYTIEVEKLSF